MSESFLSFSKTFPRILKVSRYLFSCTPLLIRIQSATEKKIFFSFNAASNLNFFSLVSPFIIFEVFFNVNSVYSGKTCRFQPRNRHQQLNRMTCLNFPNEFINPVCQKKNKKASKNVNFFASSMNLTFFKFGLINKILGI